MPLKKVLLLFNSEAGNENDEETESRYECHHDDFPHYVGNTTQPALICVNVHTQHIGVGVFNFVIFTSRC